MRNTTSTLYAVLAGTAVLFSALVFYLPAGERVAAPPPDAYVPTARAEHRPAERQAQTAAPASTGGQTLVRQTAARGPQDSAKAQQAPANGETAVVQQAEVQEDFRNHLRKDQPDLLAFHEGFNRMLQGNYAGAVESFERLTKQPAHGDYFDDALYWLGYSLAELGRDDDALAALQNLVDRFPASPYADDALLKCGMIHQQRGDAPKAEACYQTALQRYPNSEASLSCAQNLATLQESRGEWKKAQDSWSNCDTQARNQLGQNDNYYSERAKNRMNFISANNDNEGKPRDLFNRGEILLAENRPAEAVDQFQTILRDFPDSGLAEAARYKAGLCHQSLGHLEEAKACLSAVLRTAGDAEVKEASRKALEEIRKELEAAQVKQQAK